jgi:hypothetical protein
VRSTLRATCGKLYFFRFSPNHHTLIAHVAGMFQGRHCLRQQSALDSCRASCSRGTMKMRRQATIYVIPLLFRTTAGDALLPCGGEGGRRPDEGARNAVESTWTFNSRMPRFNDFSTAPRSHIEFP